MAARSASPASTQILSEIGFVDLADDWAIVRIEELLCNERGISVGVMYPGEHDPLGIPLIKAGDLSGSRINSSPEFRITAEKHYEYRRTELAGGELLVSLVGDVGRCALVPKYMAGWNVARAVAVLRFESESDGEFVRACLMSPPFQHLMRAWSTTTVQATLNLKEIRQIPLPWPPAAQRDAIARILGTLEDKIELNRRRNQTLEAMARALFKDWFVDFGPVRAKREAHQPYLPADLWQLFSDRLDDEGKPEGWGMRALGDCFRLTMGQSPPGDTYNDIGDGLPFFQGRTDFGFRYPENRKYCSAPTRIADAEDTLVSVRAPVGDINLAWEKCCIGRGVAAVRHLSGAESFTYYAVWSIQDDLRQYEHTGTVFGAINRKQFESIGFIEPLPELIESFEKKVSPMDHEVRNNIEESRTLAQLRDALLAKLISGELRIADAEKLLESAGL